MAVRGNLYEFHRVGIRILLQPRLIIMIVTSTYLICEGASEDMQQPNSPGSDAWRCRLAVKVSL